ncbi:MAG: hypothetical protein EPO07_11110 [Verrucomicrobia bacterium]|nr:MAG: hypothetical protein EPO07_11110 [Verrucomicrobiota bacterium]
MKIRLNQHNGERGTILVVTMLICGILGLLMGSYLYLVKTQNLSVNRAQAWNRALVVAEAGVEEAMAHINSGTAKANSWGVNGWTDKGSGLFQKTSTFGDSSYTVTISQPNVAVDPVITSVASVPAPMRTNTLSRKVVVGTKSNSGNGGGVAGAMVVSTTVNFNGFGINTDSFNSTNLVKFPGGLYNSTNAMDNGDVWSMSANTNAVDIGNGKIHGSVHTAPGGKVSVGSGGSVGDNGYVNGGNTGIQKTPKDHQLADGNLTFPDATLPDTKGKLWLPPVAGSYKINGITYKYLLTGNQPWKLATLDGGVYVDGPGVLLWITGDATGTGVKMGSRDEIRITSKSGVPGDLSIYSSAPYSDFGGNGIINDTGLASKFKYFGLPGNTELTFGANVGFVGQIYAPQADFKLGGGGKNTYDFVGQSITRSATMGGHFNFHYDEGTVSPSLGGSATYAAVSWDEPGGY